MPSSMVGSGDLRHALGVGDEDEELEDDDDDDDNEVPLWALPADDLNLDLGLGSQPSFSSMPDMCDVQRPITPLGSLVAPSAADINAPCNNSILDFVNQIRANSLAVATAAPTPTPTPHKTSDLNGEAAFMDRFS
jgi:hypothetical protein